GWRRRRRNGGAEGDAHRTHRGRRPRRSRRGRARAAARRVDHAHPARRGHHAHPARRSRRRRMRRAVLIAAAVAVFAGMLGCRAFDETLDGHTWRVLQDPTSRPQEWPLVTVPAGAFYVLGDNRDNSHDSRFWGFVPAENVKGTAVRIWYSAGKNGKGPRWDRV